MRTIGSIASIAALAAALSALAPAAGAEPMTAERAVTLAVANNLGLASQRVDVETRRLVRDTAWDRFIPSLTAGTTLARRNEGTDTAYLPATPPRWMLRASLSASLPLSAALRDGIRATVLDYESGSLSLEAAEKQLGRDVRKSFYNLILLQQNIALEQQNIENAQRRYDQARANYQAGLVPEYTVLSAQVALENLKPDLEDMRNAYDAALGDFRLTLGLERDAPVEIQGAIEITPVSLDVESLIRTRIGERYDIRGIDNDIASLRNARSSTVNQRMTPTLTLSFLADPTFRNDPFKGGWLSDTKDNWSQSQGAFAISLSVPLDPLVPDSQARVEVAKLDGQIRQAEIRREQAVRSAELQIESLVRNLEKARNSISTLELNVNLAERAYRLAEEAYNAGGRELLEVQNAELELSKARLDVLKARFTYITGLLDLEYAVNMSLGQGGPR